MRAITFEAIGTQWSIESDQEVTHDAWQSVIKKVQSRIEVFDKTYSRFRNDSLVSEISKHPGVYEFPEDSAQLFDFYRQMYDATDGRVTPLVGSLMSEAGYDAQYSLKPQETIHPAPKWDDVMTYRDGRLETSKLVTLDFGAAGKGYLVDIIGKLLQQESITDFIIDASGDILRRTDGETIHKIGLEHPWKDDEAIGVLNLENGSICASATNRRQWAGLHHVIDPISLEPVSSIIATWVAANNTIIADGMATALFFSDPQMLQKKFSFEYCIVNQDMAYSSSANFPAEFF